MTTTPKKKIVKKPTALKVKKTKKETAASTPKKEKTSTPKKTLGVNFKPGSDMAVVWEEALKGGESRKEVIENCKQRFEGAATTGGNPKPVSTILNQVLTRAVASGYRIEQSWKVVPVDGGTPAEETTTPESTEDTKPVKKKSIKKPSASRKKLVKKAA